MCHPFFPLKIVSIASAIENAQAVFNGIKLPGPGIPEDPEIDRYVLCLPQVHAAFRAESETIPCRFRLAVPKNLGLLTTKEMTLEVYCKGALLYKSPLEELSLTLALAVEVEIYHTLNRKNGLVITQV